MRQLFWECTLRCNLHCRHCGSDCKVKAGLQDMPLADSEYWTTSGSIPILIKCLSL